MEFSDSEKSRIAIILFCLLLIAGITNGSRVKRSDDTSPLDPVVQQLTQRLTSLEAELATVKNSVASNSGQLHKVVAFTTFFSREDVTLSPQGHLLFDNVETNIGNGYNKNSGIFTAPYAGTYVFLLAVTSQHHHWIQVAIDNSGTILAIAHSDNTGDIWDKATAHVTVHLNAGDQVWARHNVGDVQIFGFWWTGFSGFLVHAD